MADLYLTPAEKYTAALGGFYYGNLPEPGTVYTQLIKDILDGSTPDKEPKNILARFIYSLYISDLGDPYPRYELAKLLYWKLHDITPTKSGSVLTVTIDGEEDYMTINTDLSRLWYKVLFGSKTDIVTEFPYIFNTIQNKLSDWELFGNTVQSGTPTPDNPIMPQGTGERTGNLWQNLPNRTAVGVDISSENGVIYFANTATSSYNVEYSIDLPAGTYTIKANANRIPANDENACIQVYNGSAQLYTKVSNNAAINGTATFAINQNLTVSLRIRLQNGVDYTGFELRPTLNSGSTAMDFEPYGYKIPISSANTTTPVYLGEVETTRKIKKLVLTGSETWYAYSAGNVYQFYTQNMVIGGVASSSAYSTIAPYGMTVDSRIGDYGCYLVSSGNEIAFQMYGSKADFPTQTEWKAYLAQQYAAGTPVTVWYVLATEETGIVNEPLMKIGDYADSMSRTQTGIDIPTVIGQNTLDVLTTVKPSSMSIEYTSADENRSRSKRISLLKSPLKKRLIK